ncbi:MAG TPA: tRNA (N6-isopentenyl adenosine(37)-C2)-methylthiotransferase MiaB [Dehalococcoidia bacterium]|nr:tRNA (N6-isopentenyl adenosine(37)-C2)-methylthiotransferase MiaB [Dehalococcoidia bacterium]
MLRYHIWTVGCQVNQADSARLGAGLDRVGYAAVARPEEADVVVVNTCAVREGAEERAVNKLATLKRLKQQRHGELKIVMMGCMIGPRTADLEHRFPFVDIFAQPQAFDDVLHGLGVDTDDLGGEFWPEAVGQTGGPTAFVPVIEGCNKFCTYCIVPYRRGRERSRPPAEIQHEVATLVRSGVREVTLLGQTVEAYGYDLPDQPDLGDLMRLIHDLPGLERIRFLTSYPRDMTERIMQAVAELPKVCESFSLPVQSGDDGVLGAMRRGYALGEYRAKVRRVRELMPGASITTDLIVGFPGETEEQFAHSLALLEELRFDKVHVATYSPRPGTIAWRRLPDDVPADEKKRRLQAVEHAQERIATEINARLLGSVQDVLVEEIREGRRSGRSRTNKLVHFDGAAAIGELVSVRITKTSPWSLQGEAAGRGA